MKQLLQIIQIIREWFAGHQALRTLGPAVTVFGSARFGEEHPSYAIGREVGLRLAKAGLAVLTGGGPGIMEAASRGAKEAGGRTAGCNILLPHEQAPNPYLDRVANFQYFFMRKTMLMDYSRGFIVLPGGIGTLDELSDALVLIQTGKLPRQPLILIGSDYWRGLNDWIQGTLVREKALEASELGFVHFVDSAEEAVKILLESLEKAPYNQDQENTHG